MSTDWKTKLLAFLHDPPHKPMRIAGHEDQRTSFLNRFGLTEEDIRSFDRTNDWQAASADRLIFPKASTLCVDWKESWMEFRHPLGGGVLNPQKFAPTATKAEEAITTALDAVVELDSDDWEKKFIAGWRVWQEVAAREQNPHFAYMVADTRIPDHTLWHHNGLAAAFSTCGGKPAFLMFQVGPVQEFIAQARSLRDLWSGSYLLSFLIAQGMLAVAEEIGPDSILYPQLRGAPLADFYWWKKGLLKEKLRASHKNEFLVPNLPNRFLALVPADRADELARAAETRIREVWAAIAGSVHEEIGRTVAGQCAGWDGNWAAQVARFPVVDWVTHAWSDTKLAVENAAQRNTPPLHGGWENHPLHHAYRWAKERIPASERESFGPDSNAGFAWALHYALTDWKFSAVKNGRSFGAWESEGNGVPKDHLDGRCEVLGGAEHEAFWELLRQKKKNRFKGKQLYGAMSAIKRLWDETYLKDALDLGATVVFQAVDEIAKISDAIENEEAQEGYYAVLAMDGDDMGQWVSGTKASPLLHSMAEKAQGYFSQHWKQTDGLPAADAVQRPLSPGYHAALSEALANFSLYCSGPIVEAFGGQIIYAGGDDVLAMLPVANALDCAQALQIVFRGVNPNDAKTHASESVKNSLNELFDYSCHVNGFVTLKKTGRGDVGRGLHLKPNWPLLVMGPSATVSVGIAVGHVRSPMQDVIGLARDAEKAAKAVEGKGAFSLQVAKRSGEAVGFSAKWGEGALAVWSELSSGTLDLSQKFAYRFVELAKELLVEGGSAHGARYAEKWSEALAQAVTLELTHALKKQGGLNAGEAQRKAEFWMSCLRESLAPRDFLHFWMAWAFLNRVCKETK